MTKTLIPYSEALEVLLVQALDWGMESLPLRESYGRVLAQMVYADRDYPPFDRAMMDGFAIGSADFRAGQRSFDIVGKRHAGEEPHEGIRTGEALQIMTGAPLPPGADAVVRIEDTEVIGSRVSIRAESVPAGLAVAQRGEDTAQGAEMLPIGTQINPLVAGTLATVGLAEVTVWKQPQVTLLSTGTEIKAPGEAIADYQIRDSNSYSLEAFFAEYRIPLANKLLVEDDPARLREAINTGLQGDVLIVSGGVSMGEADFIPSLLREAGVEQHFHKVQIKPGKPLWFGSMPGGTVVFGLPGNPVSTQVAFKLFVEPWLRQCFRMIARPWQHLPLAMPFEKKTPFEQFVPARLAPLREQTVCQLLPLKSSGDILSPALAGGIAWLPEGKQELKAGTIISYMHW